VPDISAFELIALAVLAVVIFGPDRLPKIAADAGRFLRQLRRYVTGARRDLRRELGPGFADVNLSNLTPRGLVRRTLLDPDEYVRDLDLDLSRDLDLDRDGRRDRDPRRDRDLDRDLDLDPGGGERGDLEDPHRARSSDRPPLQPGERPPFDPDTT
jgi:sec-independent protein translocase protein TatB